MSSKVKMCKISQCFHQVLVLSNWFVVCYRYLKGWNVEKVGKTGHPATCSLESHPSLQPRITPQRLQVPQCHHNAKKYPCKLFRFPKNKKDRQQWLRSIKRTGEPSDNDRVCSCHFRDGRKENGPELFEWNISKLFQQHHLTPEKRKPRRRLDVDHPSTSAAASLEEEFQPLKEEFQPLEEAVTASTSSGGIKHESKPSYEALQAELYLAKLELEKKEKAIADLTLKMQRMRVEMRYSNICEKNNLILEYTGLPTRELFEAVLTLIESVEINYYMPWKMRRLSVADQLLMALMKLRHNFPHADLAYRFGVSAAAVTNVVVTFIHLIHDILYEQFMEKIPSRQKNKSCLPNCASTFTNCRIILDCTDVSSAVPRKSMKTERLTYSSYKHRNTLKGLVGVAPNGVVTFVSALYPGSTSDKSIVLDSGVLNQMEAGDLVIADKGFLIRDLLPAGVSVNIPPFLCRPQFTREEVRRTKSIARCRIHVERAIQRMKCFRILNFIPSQLFPYASIIFKAVGALTNMQYPLIREVSQYYTDESATDDINYDTDE